MSLAAIMREEEEANRARDLKAVYHDDEASILLAMQLSLADCEGEGGEGRGGMEGWEEDLRRPAYTSSTDLQEDEGSNRLNNLESTIAHCDDGGEEEDYKLALRLSEVENYGAVHGAEADDAALAIALQEEEVREQRDRVKKQMLKSNDSIRFVHSFSDVTNSATTEDLVESQGDYEDDDEEGEREALFKLRRGAGPGNGPAMYANTRKSMKGVDSDITDFHNTSTVVQQSIVNSLAHNMKGTVKGQDTRGRVSRETYSTSGGVIDEKSIGVVRKWINIGVIDSVRGVVATGKEATVYHAIGTAILKEESVRGEVPGLDLEKRSPEDIDYAVKIFKRVLAGFSNRLDYMEGDERYSHKKHLRLKQREIVIIWAEKEWRNLKRMYSNGVRCPHPIALKDNVILMEFIGHKATPAPKLKDALPRFKSEERVIAVFAMVIDIIRDMYQLCHLVHGDLSEYNLLYFDSLVYVIDVGQAVQSHHPQADAYLRRDIKAVCSFFSLNGVTLPTTEAEIFAMVKEGAADADREDADDVDDLDLEEEVEKDV